MADMIQVSVDDDAFLRRLGGIWKHLQDMRPLAGVVDPVVYKHFREWFDSEGQGSWEPLSPKYEAWKQANYPGKPILQRTGRLYESLEGPGGQDSIRRWTRDKAEWGTRTPYAYPHQDGGEPGPPQRKVIEIDNDFRKNFLQAARLWLRTGLRPGGPR